MTTLPVFYGEGPCDLLYSMLDRDGYARVYRDGKTQQAHRVAWMDAHGKIPDGMCVCHHCDTPNCVNVKHLFLGTHGDNARDREAKGRGLRGRGIEATRAYCSHGHELNSENTMVSAGRHRCRACYREQGKRWYATKGRTHRGVRTVRVSYEATA